MEHARGLKIHFIDGTALTVNFPQQLDNRYARDLFLEETLKRRLLMVEAEGALLYVPFENVKYMTAFPAPEELPKHVVRGATVTY